MKLFMLEIIVRDILKLNSLINYDFFFIINIILDTNNF